MTSFGTATEAAVCNVYTYIPKYVRTYIHKYICSAPEYGRSSVDLTYRSVSTTGKDSQENSQ